MGLALTLVLLFAFLVYLLSNSGQLPILTGNQNNTELELINNNSDINVSVNSKDKLRKFMIDRFPNAKKLTIVISSEKFDVGINSYWEMDNGEKKFFAGYSTNLTQDTPSVNLSVDIQATKEYEWNEEGTANYLEAKLYEAVLKAQDTTGNSEKLIEQYQANLADTYSSDLFKVKYVE